MNLLHSLIGGACTKALAMSICNQREVGSIPIISTHIAGWTGEVPAQSHKLNDEGSIPSPATKQCLGPL
jgi:hypothetical protein